MRKEEFREKWDDIADCATEWGLYSTPWIHTLDVVGNAVTKSAGCKYIIPIKFEEEFDTEESEACKEQKSKLETVDTPTKAPTNTPTDLISRQAVIDLILDAQDGSGQTYEAIRDLLHEVAYMPPVEPKLYGNEHNCIMTIFGECSYSETGCGSCAAVEKVRDALAKTQMKTQNSNENSNEDAISRADTIKAMCRECTQEGRDECREDCTEVAVVKGMPPVEPERPKGEWIESYFNEWCGTDENHNSVFRKIPCVKCDQCGEKRRDEENFCPNCGADMRGDK